MLLLNLENKLRSDCDMAFPKERCIFNGKPRNERTYRVTPQPGPPTHQPVQQILITLPQVEAIHATTQYSNAPTRQPSRQTGNRAHPSNHALTQLASGKVNPSGKPEVERYHPTTRESHAETVKHTNPSRKPDVERVQSSTRQPSPPTRQPASQTAWRAHPSSSLPTERAN